MKLMIKGVSGLSFILDVPQQSMISDIKFVIFHHLGVAPIQQNLVFRGEVLKDQTHASFYGIKNGSTLFLALKGTVSQKKLDSIHEKLDNICVEQALNRTKEVMQGNKSFGFFITQNEIDEYIRENLELERNPAAAAEANRLADIALDNWESQPGGFNELVQNYKEFEDSEIESILLYGYGEYFDDYDSEIIAKNTIIPEKAESPSTDPLPNPFSKLHIRNSQTMAVLPINSIYDDNNDPNHNNLVDKLQNKKNRFF